ncbi:hypothetical protein [Flavobacterium sp. HBTb2-11-1]|uniref:hypothetical protein n=1 Tax=Flavobacterium sp. HBTb2-11-1 TaxID=2692212 RepID=UPI00136DC3DC|nr:hypothetical protein [Flavobacterium sp. HBTb2-11-1]MXO05770.1 hypothetical protein [Flavobacterium sp. HBTb2-11-1]
MNKNSTIIHDTIIVRDTIYQTISATKIDKAEVYKDILTNQTSTNNTIFLVFFGLLTLFIGASYLYNITVAKTQIIKQTKKIFAAEKKKMHKEIKEDLNEKFYKIRGESARLFSNQCLENTPLKNVQLLYWICQCIKYYSKIKDGGLAVRQSCKRAIKISETIKTKKAECKPLLLEQYPNLQRNFYKIFEKLPLELSEEKNKLKELLDEIVS